MPVMPLNTDTPDTDVGTDGHVVDPTTQQKTVVILQPEESAAVRNVSDNLTLIKQVSNTLSAIENVNRNISEIQSILNIKDKLGVVVDEKNNIRRLAKITNELTTLADNITLINNVINNLDILKAVNNYKDEYLLLYNIREHIVSLNVIKEKLLVLVNNLHNIDINAENIDDINLVAEHMLAVEIVAQHIDLLRWFINNISTFTKLVDIHPDLKKFTDNLSTAEELIGIVDELPNTLNQFKADLDLLKTNLTEEFKQETEAKYKEMVKAYEDFMNESLKIRSQVMDLDRDFINFKSKSVEDYANLKETLNLTFATKEEVAKAQFGGTGVDLIGYLTEAKAASQFVPKTQLDSLATKDELDLKADKTELDELRAKFDTKADLDNTYNKEEVDAKLVALGLDNHYTKEEVNQIVGQNREEVINNYYTKEEIDKSIQDIQALIEAEDEEPTEPIDNAEQERINRQTKQAIKYVYDVLYKKILELEKRLAGDNTPVTDEDIPELNTPLFTEDEEDPIVPPGPDDPDTPTDPDDPQDQDLELPDIPGVMLAQKEEPSKGDDILIIK